MNTSSNNNAVVVFKTADFTTLQTGVESLITLITQMRTSKATSNANTSKRSAELTQLQAKVERLDARLTGNQNQNKIEQLMQLLRSAQSAQQSEQ